MGEVAVGDLLYRRRWPSDHSRRRDRRHGRDGPATRSRFSDGAVIVADAEHQWLTETRAARKSKSAAERRVQPDPQPADFPAVVTTDEIGRDAPVRTAKVGPTTPSRRQVPCSGASTDLPLAPYVLGAWLGDGHTRGNRITSETAEIPMYIEARRACDVRSSHGAHALLRSRCASSRARPTRRMQASAPRSAVRPVRLRRLPAAPAAAPTTAPSRLFCARSASSGTSTSRRRTCAPRSRQRRDLLAGLMDTDGTVVDGVGSCQFAVTNRRLADDVCELVVSLGYKCGRTSKPVRGRTTGVLDLLHPELLHDRRRLPPGAQAAAPQGASARIHPARIGRRYITDVVAVEACRCAASRSTTTTTSTSPAAAMIPTHNSTLALDLCRCGVDPEQHGLVHLQPGDEPRPRSPCACCRPRRRCR